MTLALAHHDSSDPHFNSHVITIRGNPICLGCSSSTIFVHLVFPILLLMFGMISQFGPIEITLSGLYLSALIISGSEILRGEKTHNSMLNMIPGFYLVSTLLYTAFVSTEFSTAFRLVLAIALALPQILIYIQKILTQVEFNHRTVKFLSRQLFITGLFFSVIDLVSSPVISLGFIATSAFIFVKLRIFSDYRVSTNKIPLFVLSSSVITDFLRRKGIINEDGIYISKSVLALVIFFTIGLVSIVAIHPGSACNNTLEIGVVSAVPAVPVIAMSRPNFCPDCGDPVDIDERYCDQCGRDLGNPKTATTQTQSSQPAQNQPNQNYNQNYDRNNSYNSRNRGYSGYGGYGAGYQGRRSYSKEEARKYAIGAGIIFFVIGFFVSNSLFIAGLVGVIAFGGLYLAMSTDNCCIQYLILDCCSDCICGILGASRKR